MSKANSFIINNKIKAKEIGLIKAEYQASNKAKGNENKAFRQLCNKAYGMKWDLSTSNDGILLGRKYMVEQLEAKLALSEIHELRKVFSKVTNQLGDWIVRTDPEVMTKIKIAKHVEEVKAKAKTKKATKAKAKTKVKEIKMPLFVDDDADLNNLKVESTKQVRTKKPSKVKQVNIVKLEQRVSQLETGFETMLHTLNNSLS